MSLQLLGHIELPGNLKPGGFDHASVHCGSGRIYVAHTANDALEVIDCVEDRFLHSIENLTGVAGALVSDEQNLVFTSNRGENTVGIFAPDNEADLAKIGVGIRPNGLAYDPGKDFWWWRMSGTQKSRIRLLSRWSWSVSKRSRLNAMLIRSGSTPNAISSMPFYLKHIVQPFTSTKIRRLFQF
jgi:hypothetical protein